MPENDLAEMFDAVSAETAEVESADIVENIDDGQAEDPVTDSVEVDVDDEVDGDTEDVVEDGSPAEDGVVEDAADSWNWEDYSDRLVPRKVNGEVEMVPLKEAIEGSMRQADYTRKTQELAEIERAAKWAQDIQEAFNRDPMGTLESFAQAYGLLDEQATGKQDGPGLDDLDEDVRPWAEQTMQAQQELQQMKRQLEQLENQRIQNEVRAEVESMKARYGDSFDPMATLQAAAQKNMSLEDAHWYVQGQRTFSERQQSAEAQAAAEKAAAEQAKATEAKRSQAKRSASSTSTKSFKASDIPADDFNDIGELFEQIANSS